MARLNFVIFVAVVSLANCVLSHQSIYTPTAFGMHMQDPPRKLLRSRALLLNDASSAHRCTRVSTDPLKCFRYKISLCTAWSWMVIVSILLNPHNLHADV